MADEQQVIYQQQPSSLQGALPFPRGFQTAGPGFSEWQLDPKDVIELIEHALRGEFWDSGEKAWITATHHDMVIKEMEQYDTNLKKNIRVHIKVPSDFTSKKAEKVNPLLSDDGIQDLLRDISSRVHRVIFMSNWNEKQLNDWLWDLGHDLTAKIFLYKDEWKILNIQDMDTIHNLIMVNTDATMRRAFLEGERRRIYEATKTTEQIITEREAQKKGFLSGIPIIGSLTNR